MIDEITQPDPTPKGTYGITPYDRWNCMSNRATGRRGGMKLLNREMIDEDVASAFVEAPLHDLAGGWVAVIVDVLMSGDWKLGQLARALNVVAERLHGVKFEQPIEGLNAMALMQGSPSEVAKQAAAAGFTINSGPPPAAKAGSRKDPLNDAILSLESGQWLEIPAGTKKLPAIYSKLNTLKKKHGASPQLHCYETDKGSIIITRSATRKNVTVGP